MAQDTPRGSVVALRAAVALVVTGGLAVFAILYFDDAVYDWLRSFHIVAVIAWMAGMLYLPRLFVYHCDAAVGSELSETFKIMERRLLRIIINPAMVITWVLGVWMAWAQTIYYSNWFIAKFILVVALSAVHGYFSQSVRRFAEDERSTDARHWRIWNEVPTVLMIAIVILVVVKPF